MTNSKASNDCDNTELIASSIKSAPLYTGSKTDTIGMRLPVDEQYGYRANNRFRLSMIPASVRSISKLQAFFAAPRPIFASCVGSRVISYSARDKDDGSD